MEIEPSLMENFHGCVLWLLAASVAKRTSSNLPGSTRIGAQAVRTACSYGVSASLLGVPSRSQMPRLPVGVDQSSEIRAMRENYFLSRWQRPPQLSLTCGQFVGRSLPATVARTKMPKSQKTRERRFLRTRGKLAQSLWS